MTTKPSYLGLLNAIANGEAEAECYLSAWAEVTPSEDVRRVLRTVALREGEHAKAFAKRLCELGFDVLPRPDPKAAERMAIASSTTLSDAEKFRRLGLVRTESTTEARPAGRDLFASFFDDTSMDVATSTLMGRYVAEERDSGRMFQSCYDALCAASPQTEPEAAAQAAVRPAVESAAESLAGTVEALHARLGAIEQALCSLATALADSVDEESDADVSARAAKKARKRAKQARKLAEEAARLAERSELLLAR